MTSTTAETSSPGPFTPTATSTGIPEPQGPVPAPFPQGGNSPARPSASAASAIRTAIEQALAAGVPRGDIGDLIQRSRGEDVCPECGAALMPISQGCRCTNCGVTTSSKRGVA